MQRKPLRRALQRADAPVAHFVEVDIERRFVELDHVDTGCLDRTRLVVQDLGERPRERLPAAIVRVVQRVDHRHRTGQRVFDAPLRLRAEERRIVDVDRMAARDGTRDDGHVRVVAVADPDRALVLEIDAVEPLDERGDEVAARLLAVGQDVDPSLFLIEDGEPDRVALRLRKRIVADPPWRPEKIGLGEPCRLGQAACQRRREQQGWRHAGLGRDSIEAKRTRRCRRIWPTHTMLRRNIGQAT